MVDLRIRLIGFILVIMTMGATCLTTGRAQDQLPVSKATTTLALKMTRFQDSQIAHDATTPTDQDSVDRIMDALRAEGKQYLELLNEADNTTGLFATADFSTDTLNGEERYYGQLEWRLFNDGLVEDLRKKEKKLLQTRLELLQLQRDMQERILGEALYRKQLYENNLYYLRAQEKVSALLAIRNQRARAARSGYTTREDYLAITIALQAAQQEQDLYERQKRLPLNAQLAELLNDIEKKRLQDKDTLVQTAFSRIDDLKIQEIFQKRAEMYPAWSDDLAVDLFIGHKKEYYDLERDYVGIKLEIPLYWDDRAAELIRRQKNIYRFQKQAIEQRIKQRIDLLTGYFALYQQKIGSAVGTITALLLRQQNASIEREHPILRQADDPERTLALLQINIIDARYRALLLRLKEYEILLKLKALTRSDDIRDLFEAAQ